MEGMALWRIIFNLYLDKSNLHICYMHYTYIKYNDASAAYLH